jgi:hypothetical protein
LGGTCACFRTSEWRGPTTWTVVSTPVLNMLQAQLYGFFYVICITHADIHMVGYRFVYDTYMVESDNNNEGPQSTAVRLKGALDTQDGGIGAT